MDILIACRSIADQHPVKIKTVIPITRIHYNADTYFPPSLENFYDMVWCYGCPIYTPFDPGNEQWFDLTQHVLSEALRVLKVGGMFVMPLNPDLIKRSSLEDIMHKAKTNIVDPFDGRLSMELTNIADMPVHVKTKYKDALVFTKTMKGAGRRSRKTRRRR
jgi:hypothetical protein